MANKLLERQYLDRALDLLDLRPNDEIQSSETPDFLVPLGKRNDRNRSHGLLSTGA